MILFVLLACSQDFLLTGVKEAAGGLDSDTAAPVEDTAGASEDSGAAEEDSAIDEDTDTEEPVDTGASTDEDPDEDPAPEDDCTDTDSLIYALARDDGQLYTFDPGALAFHALGTIDCGTSQTPGSMAVSRSGTAYVRYADNSVYAVDLATLRCSATSYSDRASGFDSFGMGYATDSDHTWHDQLYVANESVVGVLDTSTWRISPLGHMPSQSELTGNADGELWAMLPLEHPASLVQISTTTGAALATIHLPSFPNTSDIDTFAFATWSGDFYVFVREYGMGSSTDVYKVTSSGTMTRVLSHVGFDVVGAGVSTCAPS